MLKRLEEDIIVAMKNQDKDKLATLRMVKGALQLEVINKHVEKNDELLISIIVKEIKTRNESVDTFIKGNRQDLVSKTLEEIRLLKGYLPTQLSSDEVEDIIDRVFLLVKPTGVSDMGKIMKEIMPLVKGKADMNLVSRLIKSKLNI
ncbi:MAG: GatB/YqeY domain-containing protein [Bacilli bacterium]